MTFVEELPDPNDYWNLFQTTGWNSEYDFTVQELEQAIHNSWYLNSVYGSSKLVGFGRVISDGIHHAFIVDLIVHPDCQGQGLGSTLLNKLIHKCKESRIKDIQLFAAKDRYSFYEKFGFEKRPVNAPGMQLK